MTTKEITCSAPALEEGQPFNGGRLVKSVPVPDASGMHPSRIVLVDCGHEYVTWLACWTSDREVPIWYCTWGHYFHVSEKDALATAAADLSNRGERGY